MRAKQSNQVLPTRERILHAAKHLFQQRGYFAVGTVEILAAAKAPKGSMYHHFPGGKEAIAIEVVRTISQDVSELMDELIRADLSVAEILRRLAKGMSSWLKHSGWKEGTLLATITVGAVPDLPNLHAAIRIAFDTWRCRIAARLTAEGWSSETATSMSQTILAAIEGAMILARVDQDDSIVIDVADRVAKLVEFAPR